MSGRTFLVVDADGNARYHAGSDYVIEFVSPVTPNPQCSSERTTGPAIGRTCRKAESPQTPRS
jgi:hypothetical protein